MATIVARTREQLRVQVGLNSGLLRHISAFTGSGSATTGPDTTIPGGDDTYNGDWSVFTNGANDGRVRRVSDYTDSTGLYPSAATATALTSPASADTYELWKSYLNPLRIHDFINDAMVNVTGRYFDPEEDISLHTHTNVLRHVVPTG